MKVYKTPHWIFDVNNQEIQFADKTSKRLPARQNYCLLALLEASGETVSYDTLLEKIWGTQYKDSNTIASVISELRKVINSAAPSVKYISTVSKKGYRFNHFNTVQIVEKSIPAVSTVEEELETASVINKLEDQTTKTSAYKSSAKWLPTKIVSQFNIKTVGLYSLLSLTIMLALLSIIKGYASDEFFSHGYKKETVITYEPGLELDFSLSRNEKWIAYTQEQVGQQSLILKNFDTNKVSSLDPVKGERFTSPTFSPDSNALIFMEHSKERCELHKIRIAHTGFLQNEKRKITNCGSPGSAVSVAYANDGESIYFTKTTALHQPYIIVRHDLKTGFERNMTSPPSSGRGDYAFAISVDGQKMAFVRNLLWEKSSVWLLNLVTGETQKLFELPELLDSISWEGEGNIIYGAKNDVYRYKIKSQKHQVINSQNLPVYYPKHAQNSLYLARGNYYQSDILTINIDSMDISELITSVHQDYAPTSLNEGEMYFLSNRHGTKGIWRSDTNGESLILDNLDVENVRNLVNYDDDHFIALSFGRIVKIHKHSGHLTWLTQEKNKINGFSFMPGTSSVVYASELNEVWFIEQLDIETGDVELLGVRGFTANRWDKHIYITNFREPGLWQYDPATRERKLLLEDFKVYDIKKWAITKDFIIELVDNKIRLYRHSEGAASFYKEIALQGKAGNISCYNNMCTFNLHYLGNSEIVRIEYGD